MDRRQLLAGGAALSVAAALPRAASAAAPRDPDLALYDRIFAAMLQASPQAASLAGLDSGPFAPLKARLDDRGPAARLNAYATLLDVAPELAAAKPGAGPLRVQWLETVRWYAAAAREMASFPQISVANYGYPVPYAVTQLSGAYYDVPDLLANQHPIANSADAEAYLSRLNAFATALDQDTEASRAQAAAGIVPPAFVCERAATQLRALAAQRGTAAGLVRTLAERTRAAGVAGAWEKRAAALVDGPLAAALARQIAQMEVLRQRAPAAAGVRGQPDGERFYAMALRFQTTTDRTPADVHRIGLEQVALLQGEADALLRRLGHRDGAVIARIAALGKDPAQLFPNTDAGREALLAFVRERSADVMRRLPAMFGRLPRTPMEVRRVPPETELGAPGAYAVPGSLDGTRPGAIYFNLSSTAEWPKWQLPSTVYHEGYPGHHFQGALANEADGLPELVKMLLPAAYGEGWGLYAEDVADELGVYDEVPLGRLGRLQQSLFRACRLVVDTGMHALGWSRERAIAYMVEQGGLTADDARREVERYVVWPGQACSYKMGHLEFLRLRAEARQRMGARFSIKAFHDAVLLGGGMPLAVMARQVERTLR